MGPFGAPLAKHEKCTGCTMTLAPAARRGRSAWCHTAPGAPPTGTPSRPARQWRATVRASAPRVCGRIRKRGRPHWCRGEVPVLAQGRKLSQLPLRAHRPERTVHTSHVRRAWDGPASPARLQAARVCTACARPMRKKDTKQDTCAWCQQRRCPCHQRTVSASMAPSSPGVHHDTSGTAAPRCRTSASSACGAAPV